MESNSRRESELLNLEASSLLATGGDRESRQEGRRMKLRWYQVEPHKTADSAGKKGSNISNFTWINLINQNVTHKLFFGT